jgi:CRISPR/Cas system CSM-associated protein Csm4 (group 5 of RAMP superfamily)
MIKTKEISEKVMAKAVAALKLKESNTEKVTTAFTLYIGAIINRYLKIYEKTPDQFFEQSEAIKAGIREYIDFMLYGVVKEEAK